MRIVDRLSWRPALLAMSLSLAPISSSWAQHHGGSGSRHHGGSPGQLGGGGVVGGISFGVPVALPYGYVVGSGIGYPQAGFGPSGPLAMGGPGGFAPMVGPAIPNDQRIGGLMLPPMPPAQPAAAPARRANPERAKEQVEIGDRSFRQGYTKRAEERYKAAVKADPSAPMPHVRLAQIELARGNYTEAADHIRDAVTVANGGNWLLNAPDIQSIYREPSDFAKRLGEVESHLQANPNDRDAWFVLGAQYYLSGRTRQAADVFQRLSDRKPDEALAAFTDAARPREPAPPPPAN